MNISAIIGENLKKIRSERNLSLGQLSALCGVSKVMLSQIEKGASNPSVNTVWKIADSLQLPYTALLDQNIEGGQVLYRKDLPVQPLDDGSGELCCYYRHSRDRNFELFQMTIQPGGSHLSDGHGERTEEYALVISGHLSLTLEDGQHDLQSGDSIRFHSNYTHRYQNSGRSLLHLVILNYYR